MNTTVKRIAVFSVGCSFFFLIGFISGINQWFPSSFFNDEDEVSWITESSLKSVPVDQAFLNAAFSDELISSEVYYKPINSLKEIYEKNKNLFIPLKLFDGVFDNIQILESENIFLDGGRTNIVRIKFKLAKRFFYSYAYYIPAHDKVGKHASLIMPGSGLNQASEIYKKVAGNYHDGVLDIATGLEDFDTYIFIQPNESILAFHNGEKKLNYDFIINYQLNQGGSYSASYVIQSIAFQKFLKERYKINILMGLSQGGLATLLNALESSPDIAVVSSGYSVLSYDKFEWSGHNQMIIPGIAKKLAPKNLASKLLDKKTSWLFTYGKEEFGTYKIEAEELLTKSYFEGFENVEVTVHERGHHFPVEVINTFLKKKLE